MTLSELIDRYWQLAYAEGRHSRQHDTEGGDAQDCRTSIDEGIMALLSRIEELEAEAETARGFEMTWKNHRDELLEKATSAEAKLAEAVKVIDLMADVVVYDATMQGPKVMGVNGSAARRAAEAARSFLQSISKPGSRT